jgi:hypothetical protein
MLKSIRLKTASQHFTPHKLIVLPTRISENKFIEIVRDFAYLPLSFNQRDFALLKEAKLQLCSFSILIVCPINVPFYDAKVPACEAELFFHISREIPACRRKLLLHHSPYYASARRHVVLPLSRATSGHYTLSAWIRVDYIQRGPIGNRHHPQCYSVHQCSERASKDARNTQDLPGADVPALYLHDITPTLSRHDEPKVGEVIPP